jgi:glycogen(starch) synthase
MDVLVNASSDEPFGLVIVEAMARGTPVVAVDSAGPSEIIESERSGLLIPTNGERDIAEGVAMLLRSPDLTRHVVMGAQERFRARFAATSMTDRFVREFDRLCALSR